jgi:hypothetical protein
LAKGLVTAGVQGYRGLVPAEPDADPRWRQLFDDLEAGVREHELGERAAEVADRTRRERAQVTLAERLAAQKGLVELLLVTGPAISGTVGDVGTDWLTLTDPQRRRWLVPLARVVQVSGLGAAADADPHTRTTRRFPLGWALRALARDRLPVVVHDRRGRRVTGTIDEVGADSLSLSEHPVDLPRRPEHVVARRTLPFSAVVAIESPPSRRPS